METYLRGPIPGLYAMTMRTITRGGEELTSDMKRDRK
jgi:hypothetical protein